jgi:hypothetical protein
MHQQFRDIVTDCFWCRVAIQMLGASVPVTCSSSTRIKCVWELYVESHISVLLIWYASFLCHAT